MRRYKQMADIYKMAFQIQAETETAADYHIIVTMLLKYGYDKTLLILMEG